MTTITLTDIRKSYANGPQVLHNINMEIKSGEFIVIVGPSGCGKSTLLRMIAGLETCPEGEISIGGRRMNEVAPQNRDIAMIFQNYALYPHMSVQENIAFGLELRGVRKAERNARAREVAKTLRLEPYLERKPGALSGGQRQRVAMGRAIARNAGVFLMDEPLSNLDNALRIEMRTEIKEIHRQLGATIIYVTHDQTEALSLSDRVAVMKDGYLQQYDTPSAIYDDPANQFVASFLGQPPMNFVDASYLPRSGFSAEWVAGLRPDAFRISAKKPNDTAIEGRVVLSEMTGSALTLHIDSRLGRILATTSRRDFDLSDGSVWLETDPSQIFFFDKVSGKRLRPD